MSDLTQKNELDTLSAFTSRAWGIAAEARDLLWHVRETMEPKHLSAFVAASESWINAARDLEHQRALALGWIEEKAPAQ